MRRGRLIVVGSMLGCIGPIAVACADGGAATHVVEMQRFAYQPVHLEVSVGDTVQWLNRELVPHTASARDGSWDSGGMDEGARWSWIADREGTVDYVCAYHPSMRGRIIVR